MRVNNMGDVSAAYPMEPEKFDYIEEKIPIHDFTSSEELKDEIGRRIVVRGKDHWDIVQIFSDGPFIYLKFRHRA